MVIDTDKHGKQTKRFININQIQQIYQREQDVIMDLIDYTEIKIQNQNLDSFMDRFI
jgi:hypothetical protein